MLSEKKTNAGLRKKNERRLKRLRDNRSVNSKKSKRPEMK